MGEFWQSGADLADAVRKLRRFLCRGEKGGLAVGHMKLGKGSKIIAVVDDHGLPLAISVRRPR